MTEDKGLINPPLHCVCGAERYGIQDRRIPFKCGSVMDFTTDKPNHKRSNNCIERFVKKLLAVGGAK